MFKGALLVDVAPFVDIVDVKNCSDDFLYRRFQHSVNLLSVVRY